MTDEEFKALMQMITVIAALLTAVINVVVVFARGKTDPTALSVISKMAKDSAANSRRQADRIDSLTATVAGELKDVNRTLGKILRATNSTR